LLSKPRKGSSWGFVDALAADTGGTASFWVSQTLVGLTIAVYRFAQFSASVPAGFTG
jgi:hypothetical protein